MSRNRVVQLTALATAVVVLVWIALSIWSGASRLSVGAVDWKYVSAVFACMLVLVIVYGLAWWLLMCRLERRRLAAWPAVRLFALSWAGRYFPAGIPHYAGRLLAGPSAGMSRTAVAASLAYENLLVLAVGAAGAALCLSVASVAGGAPTPWILAGLVIAALSFGATLPWPLRWLIDVAEPRVPKLASLRGHILALGSITWLSAAYALGFVLNGGAYYFALLAVGESPPPLVAFAAYNIAGVIGMLAIGVPSGLGVREAVVAALMGAVMPVPLALSAAVLVRVAGIAADLVPAAVAGASFAVRRPPVVDTARPTMREAA